MAAVLERAGEVWLTGLSREQDGGPEQELSIIAEDEVALDHDSSFRLKWLCAASTASIIPC